jgi:hypothetical protein
MMGNQARTKSQGPMRRDFDVSQVRRSAVGKTKEPSSQVFGDKELEVEGRMSQMRDAPIGNQIFKGRAF